MNYEIKKATLEDLDTAAELFIFYRIFYRQADDLEKCKQFIKERLDNDQSIFLIVYVDGKSSGFTQLYKLYHYIKLAKQWLLSDLFVHLITEAKWLSVALIDRAKQM